MSDALQGVRLAKRVAALQGCSRSQAEAMIAAGAVWVDGQIVTDPARRVQDETLRVEASPAVQTGPLTLLVHWPAQWPTDWSQNGPENGPTGQPTGRRDSTHDSLQQVLAHLQACAGSKLPPPARLALLRPVCTLGPGQCGLAVWSDDPSVLRRIHDRQQPLEHEWRLSTAQALPDDVQADLSAQGWRISLSQQSPGRLAYRLVGKRPEAPRMPAGLAGVPGRVVLELRHLRLGRLGLAPLQAGQARLLRAAERF